MSLLSFNPLHYADRLEKTGVPREEAKVHADAITELLDEKVATKQDLQLLKSELREEILKVRTELIEKLASKSEMRWLFGVTTTMLALLMTAFRFLH